MSGIESLYRNFGILADAADQDIIKHISAYEGIIQATKGTDGEKKLAPSFITKFFRHFPSLQEAATDAILDLIEDEDPQIRRLAIKTLPDICEGGKDDSLYIRVSDVLAQLLLIEDPTELECVRMSMATVLQANTKYALVGIFDQIMGEDENIREKGLEYISGPLMTMKHKLFNQHPEVEEFLYGLIKKVLVDVTGKEFEMLMDLSRKLAYTYTLEGCKELRIVISDQAELTTVFKPDNVEFIDKFITCFRQALTFPKCASITVPFIEYLCINMLPGLDHVKEDQSRQEILQLLSEACLLPITKDVVVTCIQNVYDYLLVHLPHPPDIVEEEQKFHFSIVECVLFTFHLFCKSSPEFFNVDPSSTRLKDLRIRLQYFARGSRAYHAQLTTAQKGKNSLDMKDEQNNLREVALRTTSNINTLLKDFFHNPPSFKTTVVLSWIVKRKDCIPRPLVQRKRPITDQESLPKRKRSPIRFEASTEKNIAKKEGVTIYSPPKDKFSRKFSDGSNFKDYGRGARGNRGGTQNKTSWRQ